MGLGTGDWGLGIKFHIRVLYAKRYTPIRGQAICEAVSVIDKGISEGVSFRINYFAYLLSMLHNYLVHHHLTNNEDRQSICVHLWILFVSDLIKYAVSIPLN